LEPLHFHFLLNRSKNDAAPLYGWYLYVFGFMHCKKKTFLPPVNDVDAVGLRISNMILIFR
jgi:hypothetical protein